jgi:hypothetical protein
LLSAFHEFYLTWKLQEYVKLWSAQCSHCYLNREHMWDHMCTIIYIIYCCTRSNDSTLHTHEHISPLSKQQHHDLYHLRLMLSVNPLWGECSFYTHESNKPLNSISVRHWIDCCQYVRGHNIIFHNDPKGLHVIYSWFVLVVSEYYSNITI